MQKRHTQHELLSEIVNRWSPRAFSTRPVEKEDVMAMIEAASLAPSCFNEQPWRFLVAYTPQSRERILSIMDEGNQIWAKNAPVLILIASKKRFDLDESKNNYHQFDAGAAWGLLSLEAKRRGLETHAMAGYNKTKARELFGISEDYSLLALIAVGYYGNPAELPEKLQKIEAPGKRKSVQELLLPIE